MAPTRSSSFRLFSTKSADQTPSTPATAPIRTAAGPVTKAQGAVIATRPARRPFPLMEGAGRPDFLQVPRDASTAPAPEASIVFLATTPILRSVPESVEPALNPNHPKARIRHPERAEEHT